MDNSKPIDLPNDRQTSIKISFAREGKAVIETGDTILVMSSAVTVLHASVNAESGDVDVIPVDDAVGQAAVTVAVTLADGVSLPPQTVNFRVRHPDADALVLTPGEIVAKAALIPVHKPNPDPVVVAPPAPPAEPAEPPADKPAENPEIT